MLSWFMYVLLSNITQLFGHPLLPVILMLWNQYNVVSPKRLPTLKNLSYRERLKCLNIFSLKLRRLHTDLFWCYKIVFGLVCVNLDDLFLAPVSTLVVINLNSTSAKPLAVHVPIS